MDIQLKEKDISLTLNEIPGHLHIEADKLHLENVFRNLIENAIKYSAEKPHLEISAEVSEKNIKLLL